MNIFSVIPLSAHVAFMKAAHYYNIEIRIAPLDKKTYKVNVKEMAKLIDKNTICVNII